MVEDEQPAADDAVSTVLTPRQLAAQRRRRRRRRRRAFGVLVFFAVAAGVFAAAYFSLVGSDTGSNGAAGRRAPRSTTTTVPRPTGPYRVVTGVNVRQGPGTNYPTVGTVETGHSVFVACVTDGESVDGPTGPSTKWVRLAGFGPLGYVTVQYVTMGSDLDIPGKIPVCSEI